MTTTPTPSGEATASQPSPAICPTCKGRGNHPRYVAPCEECDGSGRVEQPSPAPESEMTAEQARAALMAMPLKEVTKLVQGEQPSQARSDKDAERALRRCSKFGHRCNCVTDCDPALPHPSLAAQAESAPSGESIDTPEFRELLRAHEAATISCDIRKPGSISAQAQARAALIAHIDARRTTAGTTAPTQYPHPDCDWACHYHCTEAGAYPPRCVTAGNAAPTEP